MESDLDSEITDYWQEFGESIDSPSKFSPSLQIIEEHLKEKTIPSLDYYDSIAELRNSVSNEEEVARLDEQNTIRNYIKFSINHLREKFEKDIALQKSINSKMKIQLYHQSKEDHIL